MLVKLLLYLSTILVVGLNCSCLRFPGLFIERLVYVLTYLCAHLPVYVGWYISIHFVFVPMENIHDGSSLN